MQSLNSEVSRAVRLAEGVGSFEGFQLLQLSIDSNNRRVRGQIHFKPIGIGHLKTDRQRERERERERERVSE